jgi:hypothetical protein
MTRDRHLNALAFAKEVVRSLESDKPLLHSEMFPNEACFKMALSHVINLSCWFEVTPEPNDKWMITVKYEHAPALRRLVKP